MILSIASGKGGTGKTTVTANLAAYLNNNGQSVAVVDCDVEEPNSHFFLKTGWDEQQTEYMYVPDIKTDACLGESCLQCVTLCEFKAMIWMAGSVMVFPELCHGCKLCSLACPADAVVASRRELGSSRYGTKDGLTLHGGEMRIGEAMATPLIRAVIDSASAPLQIRDCPPGTACPVIASLQDSDFVVLVCEPTPFGLHDLKLAVGLVREMKLPFGVVINRAGMGDNRVEEYLAQESIPLLASLPHTVEAARAYSEGKLLIDALPEFEDLFRDLWHSIQHHAGASAAKERA